MNIGNFIEVLRYVYKSANGHIFIDQVKELLFLVALLPYMDNRYLFQFSGRYKQKVGIAYALTGDPFLFIDDKPVSGFHVSIRIKSRGLRKQLHKSNELTYLVISYDLAVLRYIGSPIAEMCPVEFVDTITPHKLSQKPRHLCSISSLIAIHIPYLEKPSLGCNLSKKFPYVE